MSQPAESWMRDPETLERMFLDFLGRRDLRGVEAALTQLAFVDPHRADKLYQTLRVALWLAEEMGGTE